MRDHYDTPMAYISELERDNVRLREQVSALETNIARLQQSLEMQDEAIQSRNRQAKEITRLHDTLKAIEAILDVNETLRDALERIADDPRAGHSVRGIARDALQCIEDYRIFTQGNTDERM